MAAVGDDVRVQGAERWQQHEGDSDDHGAADASGEGAVPRAEPAAQMGGRPHRCQHGDHPDCDDGHVEDPSGVDRLGVGHRGQGAHRQADRISPTLAPMSRWIVRLKDVHVVAQHRDGAHVDADEVANEFVHDARHVLGFPCH
jgi:hypothetical protein